MEINSPSNRAFGFLLSTVFALASAITFYQKSSMAANNWIIASVVAGLIAIFAPRSLTYLNKAWMRLGKLMGKIISPLVLGVIFFLLITPIAIIARSLGRDTLRLHKPPVQSYWIDRLPEEHSIESFKYQF